MTHAAVSSETNLEAVLQLPANPLADSRPRTKCDRCVSTSYLDKPIHGGQSVRRDCARCQRILGFTIWYGKPTELEQ